MNSLGDILRGIDFAEEYLVRRNQFTERTLDLLGELRKMVESGDFRSDLHPNWTTTEAEGQVHS